MKLFVFALCIASALAVDLGKKCYSKDDCEDGQCCVNYVLVENFGGFCKPMRKEGEGCTPLVKIGDEEPKMHHYACPCEDGLECIAEAEIEIFGHTLKHRPTCKKPTDKEE